MANRPLVSAICGSFDRPDMLAELIENLREQVYRPLELCVAVEPSSDKAINDEYRSLLLEAEQVPGMPIRWTMLGRHWSSFLANSISAVPFQTAQWLAGGEYLMWSADDERFTPDHVEKLVALAEREQADFVYPLQGCYWRGSMSRHLNWIGAPTPAYGQITHALFKSDLLDYRGFMTHVGSGTDWDQVDHWVKAGARWAFLPEKTFTHRVDKAGDGNARLTRRPLRGHTPRTPEEEASWRSRSETDCWTCGAGTNRVCWCHNNGSGGSDNKPCKCARVGLVRA